MQKINVFSLLFTLWLFIGSLANAQVKKLEVRNKSGCEVHYQILTSVMSPSPVCGVGYTSTVISIPPGGYAQFYSDAVPSAPDYIPGMPTGYVGYILAAKIIDAPMSCVSLGVLVGEASCGFSAFGTLPMVSDFNCNPCSPIDFKWYDISPLLHSELVIY